ncbi:MAG: type II/IV secretion system protein [Burkholderiales bacterium]|nr:type II/IV secretion system protein [Burkholderiales bacterium]
MPNDMITGARRPARNASELDRALRERAHDHLKLGQLLVRDQVITVDTLRRALELQHRAPARKLGEILSDMGALTAAQAEHAVTAALEMPAVQLADFDFDPLAVALVPADMARQHHLIPLMFHKHMLVLAIHALPDSESRELLSFTVERPVQFVLASREEIDEAIGRNYHAWSEKQVLASLATAIPEQDQQYLLWQEANKLAQQQPMVKLVDSMLTEAIRQRASDIHIRPGETGFEVLYRIDGTLIPIRDLPKSLQPALTSRVKILSRLNIAEHRLPQDGRIRYQDDKRQIDMRVSVIPVQYGESVVIRLLDKSLGLRSVREIGFGPADQARFLDLIKRSYGIVLVTGPTGSGKSTTLYAALQEVEKENINVVTVEDPIEYDLPRTRQIQVQPVIDFGFPEALRHILRHDPDVIMIGEMRDTETCKIAVESALTGHLVLSTLHTNDAPGTLVRLLELGVAPYMIRSAVIGVLAQRLVRCNCTHCIAEESVDALVRENMGVDRGEIFHRGRGCEHCRRTGFSGRMAIYELLVMNDELRASVREGVASDEYQRLAIKSGMVPMALNGLAQARTQRVSLSEVYRACM